jgi:hypothetical protein
LTATALSDATIAIDGQTVSSGVPWKSPILNLGKTEIILTVTMPGRGTTSYALVVERGEPERLVASNAEPLDYFGDRVAISGDTLVVGAFGEASGATTVDGNQADNSAPYRGAAYVFVRTATGWSQQAYLKPSGSSHGFSTSVAISGDTIAIGARGTDQHGSTYVFVRDRLNKWSEQAHLSSQASGGEWPHNQFGDGVAISGNTLLVGSPGEAPNGAAYIFVRQGSAWEEKARLISTTAFSDSYGGERFGTSVAISGDTVIVGTPRDRNSARGVNPRQRDRAAELSGAAYIFARTGDAWSRQAYLKASNADADDFFGYSVAISGNTAVVGAMMEASAATGVNGNQSDNTGPENGAAYVFQRAGSTWSQQAYLKPSSRGEQDRFGGSVAIGADTIVVGTDAGHYLYMTREDLMNPGRGHDAPVYVFVRHGQNWFQQMTPEVRADGDPVGSNINFGYAVSLSNGTLAVNAPGESVGRGAVYVFD